jgi:hypothetical protein
MSGHPRETHSPHQEARWRTRAISLTVRSVKFGRGRSSRAAAEGPCEADVLIDPAGSCPASPERQPGNGSATSAAPMKSRTRSQSADPRLNAGTRNASAKV